MPGIKRSDFVTGGIVPVDKNLLWAKCRYAIFDYINKAGETVASTVAAQITYKDDGGAETVQNYSVGDPKKWQPSEDGKTLVNVAGNPDEHLSTSSNFYVLIDNLINAGFPENKLLDSGDISVLDGLYAFHIGVPEPKRAGLAGAEPRADGRERVISVPSKILRLPWEGKGKGKATPITTGKPAAKGASKATMVKLAARIATLIDESGDTASAQRAEVATDIFKTFGKDADKNAMASAVYAKDTDWGKYGLALDGETISRAE